MCSGLGFDPRHLHWGYLKQYLEWGWIWFRQGKEYWSGQLGKVEAVGLGIPGRRHKKRNRKRRYIPIGCKRLIARQLCLVTKNSNRDFGPYFFVCQRKLLLPRYICIGEFLCKSLQCVILKTISPVSMKHIVTCQDGQVSKIVQIAILNAPLYAKILVVTNLRNDQKHTLLTK